MNPPTKFRLVNPGPMGEAKVLKALLGPQTEVKEMSLKGFEVRKQPRPPENVWSVIKEFWDDAGHPYGGAYSLLPNEDATAIVGCVEFDSPAQLKPAAQKLGFWSFHDSKHPEDAWYQYKEIRRDGDVSYVTERVKANPDTLEVVPDNYRETEEYKTFIDEMARQANEYRESLNSQNPELQFSPATGESKA